MKKVVAVAFSLVFMLFPCLVFSSEVGDLLKKATMAYESGDITIAIANLDSAKEILEKERISSVGKYYIEIANWDIVKVKKSEYLGKKVKIKTKFNGINHDGTVWLGFGLNNPYESSLIDKVLTLTKYKEYVFYGTVIDNYLGPMLNIDGIE